MRAPVRPLRGTWPKPVETRLSRFFWADPRVVLDDDVSPEAFRAAMSAMHVGATIKITGAGRHSLADQLVLDNVELRDANIVDIGASDGSTSVDLISKLPDFSSYTIADLYFHLSARRVGSHVLFYDPHGSLVLVVGNRLVAWPSSSRTVGAIYRPFARRAESQAGEDQPVLMLNPAARALIATDQRVTYRVHDVFSPWASPTPDLIKVANLLRRLYFTDSDIRRGLQAVFDSLAEGGHLLLVDNPRIAGIDERAGLYRRESGRFVLVAQTEHPTEVDDLVGTVGNASAS